MACWHRDTDDKILALSDLGVVPGSGFSCPLMLLGFCPFYLHTCKVTPLWHWELSSGTLRSEADCSVAMEAEGKGAFEISLEVGTCFRVSITVMEHHDQKSS